MNIKLAGLSLLLLVYGFLALAADEDMLQDVCVADMNITEMVNGFHCKESAVAEDFKSNILSQPGNTSNVLGSRVTLANVFSFPGVNTLGVAFARIDYAVNGTNPPHIHPRATEILFLQEGTLLVGFVTTAPEKLFVETLQSGDLFVFPRGLVHFQLNVGDARAVAYAGFNSQNPGTSQVAKAVFNPPIDDRVIQITFQLQPDMVSRLRELIRNT